MKRYLNFDIETLYSEKLLCLKISERIFFVCLRFKIHFSWMLKKKKTCRKILNLFNGAPLNPFFFFFKMFHIFFFNIHEKCIFYSLFKKYTKMRWNLWTKWFIAVKHFNIKVKEMFPSMLVKKKIFDDESDPYTNKNKKKI